MNITSDKKLSYALVLLILVQSLCAIFFLNDAILDYQKTWPLTFPSFYLLMEGVAALVLMAGVAFEVRYLMQMLRRQAHMARALTIASGALHELIEGYFHDWGLTPAEQDVATFTIKGSSISEVAGLRGSAEGTVKAHLNAIYRKAGVSGRGELVSLMIEDLMNEALIGGEKPPLALAN